MKALVPSYTGLIIATIVVTHVMSAPPAPELNLPVDEAKNQTTAPTLSWNAVTGATSYHLQVSEDRNFGSTIADITNITSTSRSVTGLQYSAISIGTPYRDGREGGYWNDQPLAYFIKPDGVTYRSWHTVGGPDGDIIEGPYNQPTQLRAGGYTWSWNGINGFATAWVMRTYQVNADTLIGFIHHEWDDTHFWFGKAVSFNMGDSWTFCGAILAPQRAFLKTCSSEHDCNVGGGAVITHGDYFYVYFNEYPSGGGSNPGVARARIAEVIEAAKQKKTSPWVKYRNGAWNGDPFRDAASRLFTVSGSPSTADLHTHATQIKSTGTYLLHVNNHGANARCLIFASTDGINWGNQYTVETGGGNHPYGTFVGTRGSGARNDQFVQGDSLRFIWTQKTSGYNDDTFKRVDIKVTPRVYYWRVRASDASGAGSWSQVRSFTTEARIQGGAPVSVSVPVTGASPASGIGASARIITSGSGHRILALSFSASSNLSAITAVVYDLSGRQHSLFADKTSPWCWKLDVSGLPAGRYLVRISGREMERTIPFSIDR